MAHRSLLMLLVFLLPTHVVARQPVPDGYQRVAYSHQVPPESLYAVALQESSRKLPHGFRPWPWSLNVAGRSYQYETRLEAWQALQRFLKTTPHKNIDIGLGQVNWGWNGSRFANSWDAFEPYTNLNVAARILRECYERQPGSWLQAAGCYHHPSGGPAAAKYIASVKHKLTMIEPGSGSISPPIASPASLFVWIEPRSSR
ncbi:transglycosylase SLT domain-containing protein [Dickeya fangzhongdai]|uniref:lytic transglycosylase domain-containing protein n=1 Tax=Dickeya fangzhongdai TaxID=1778540 RepID=UPI002B263D9E|nr:lytic transglycosylase domain-containing protein [Dickeya fangzhongdai]WOY02053.1 transglycosylase SLT domain-containing protein [Dickeya fangzhongdai]